MARVTNHETSRPVIVVGVDGSSQSLEALHWASQYASLCGGELRAVIVWEHLAGFGYFAENGERLEREARHTLERSIQKAFGRSHAIPVEMRVVRGNPTPVLIAESADAQLLVVGHRGYGGFAGLLLGSVGENCVRHATCSVVVAREKS